LSFFFYLLSYSKLRHVTYSLKKTASSCTGMTRLD